jgi:DNA repair protein RecN (Recombination protein N)
LRTEIETQRDREDLLAYQVGELDNLSLEQDEVKTLEVTQKRLTQAQYIQATAMATLEQIDASEVLSGSRQKLADIDDEHPSLTAALGLMETAITHLEETRRELDDYLQSLDSEQATLSEISRRLDSIYDLARKHRVHANELLNHHQVLSEELAKITNSESDLEALAQERDIARKAYLKAGKKLSSARHAAADEFAGGISRYMQSLGITAGALSLEFRDEENAKGLESIEYLVVTNPNYPAAPLAKVASGGERTRISLAVQVVAAEKSNLPCLVLDEADVGVGGTTADVVGRLLRGLGQHTQVLCVTHAPQVAALGDHHLRVGKSQEHDTEISLLSDKGRITELSRMLAGADVTEKTRNYAQTLLSEAQSEVH